MSLSPIKPITIKSIKVAYLTTKVDNYKNETSYFKLSSKDIDGKLGKLKIDGYKLPWFTTEEGKYLLKVKSKNVNISDLEKMKTYIVDISFKYYKIDNTEGYYISLIV